MGEPVSNKGQQLSEPDGGEGSSRPSKKVAGASQQAGRRQEQGQGQRQRQRQCAIDPALLGTEAQHPSNGDQPSGSGDPPANSQPSSDIDTPSGSETVSGPNSARSRLPSDMKARADAATVPVSMCTAELLEALN
ncbi:hypothetical protein CC86DRAFT_452573 [Ophiobolus disseminans]|uniref:Uncharacterized protein n=1 Tax=Ophiobolus disseminans TaxID=1469910 RepID=A0A6A7AFV0_9PLEO|nr:hypothetical protein CC86DRAFT_452573 [Ophiobolus disseminans]